MLKVIKSEPNEINAIIRMVVDNDSFTIEYTYDSEEITFDELIPMDEVKNRVENYRKQGLKGFVLNDKINNNKLPY